MTVEENLELVGEIERVINERNWDGFRRVHANDVVFQGPTDPAPEKGIDKHVEGMESLLHAFPDMKMKVVRTFSQGDQVCLEYSATGTHKGPLEGPGGKMIEATGRGINIAGVSILNIANNRIVKERDYWDTGSLMSQLGLMPEE